MCDGGKSPAGGGTAKAKKEAMIGEATLVPPTSSHPPWSYVSYIATPVFGSATAATSLFVRFEQPESCCQAGFFSKPEHPDPVPDHTVSVQPRELEDVLRLVPPTAGTNLEAAGYDTP